MKAIYLSEILSFLEIKEDFVRSDDCLISGLAIDSREAKENFLFFCLPGKRVDGHFFLKEVSRRKGVAAIVSEDYVGENFGLKLIKVPNVFNSLQLAAKNKLKKSSTRVIGVAGSIGKTTCKDFITTLLKSKYKVFSTPKNWNTKLTLPLTILLSDGDEDFLVLEMGISEPGDMEKLVCLAPPEIAIITNVFQQHSLFFLNGEDDIFLEKSTIFNSRKLEKGFFCIDSPHYRKVKNSAYSDDILTFSFNDSSADIFYEKISDLEVIIKAFNNQIRLPIRFSYKPAYQNFLIAVGVVSFLGLSFKDIENMLKEIKLPSMRFEEIEKNDFFIINDAYNANPESMIAAIEAVRLPEFSKGKIILILGHMAELGMYKREGHEKVLIKAIQKGDIIMLLGEFWLEAQRIWKNEKKRNVRFYLDKKDLEKDLCNLVEKRDVILLKGSRSLELETLISCF